MESGTKHSPRLRLQKQRADPVGSAREPYSELGSRTRFEAIQDAHACFQKAGMLRYLSVGSEFVDKRGKQLRQGIAGDVRRNSCLRGQLFYLIASQHMLDLVC